MCTLYILAEACDLAHDEEHKLAPQPRKRTCLAVTTQNKPCLRVCKSFFCSFHSGEVKKRKRHNYNWSHV